MRKVYQSLSVVAAVCALIMALCGHSSLSLVTLAAVMVWAGQDR